MIPKLTEEEMEIVKKLSASGVSNSKIGRRFGVDHSTIAFQLGRLKRKPVLKNPAKRIRNYKKAYIPKFVPEVKPNLSYAEICERQAKIKVIRDKFTGEAVKVKRIDKDIFLPYNIKVH